MLSRLLLHVWAVCHRQSLYDNEQGIQDRFALFWEEVAKHFAGNPYVLGECRNARSIHIAFRPHIYQYLQLCHFVVFKLALLFLCRIILLA